MPLTLKHEEKPCSGCGAPVVWMVTRNGKRMPVDAKTAKFGDTMFDAKSGHVSHFATCPKSEQFRKPKK